MQHRRSFESMQQSAVRQESVSQLIRDSSAFTETCSIMTGRHQGHNHGFVVQDNDALLFWGHSLLL
jgi:hypothetical protein